MLVAFLFRTVGRVGDMTGTIGGQYTLARAAFAAVSVALTFATGLLAMQLAEGRTARRVSGWMAALLVGVAYSAV